MHIPPEESLIEYPSDFPIKVMGKQHPELAQTLTELVLQFDPGFDAATVEMRPSKGGNYMGLTLHRARHLARTARRAVPRAAWPPHGVDRHLGRHGCDQVARESGRLPVGLARHAGLHQPARRRHAGRDLAASTRRSTRWGRRARPGMCSIPPASPSCIATGAGRSRITARQVMAYALFDLRRVDMYVKEYVTLLEGAVIDTLAEAGVAGACRKPGAPGVYAGSRWRRRAGQDRRAGHQDPQRPRLSRVSLNVDMDLAPFLGINPAATPACAPSTWRPAACAASWRTWARRWRAIWLPPGAAHGPRRSAANPL